jgi:uncharacterized protein (TIGR00290 family)
MSRSRQEIAVKKILLAWSSGKDSAWALWLLRTRGLEVSALLTTLNQEADRVAMHGVRRSLLEAQSAAVGIPLRQVPLPWPCANREYETRMAAACAAAVADGFDTIAFGDLFLRDVREYRERALAGTGLTPLFPVWGVPTASLAREMTAAGLRARLTCIDPRVLDRSFAGREFDAALLADLPPSVDPCGENGEFHTFAYDGPMFRTPIAVSTGETVERSGFLYTDLTTPPSAILKVANRAD